MGGDIKMKRKLLALSIWCIIMLCGCAGTNDQYENSEDIEQIEGYEGLKDEQINQKLIEECDKIEVVPDDKK